MCIIILDSNFESVGGAIRSTTHSKRKIKNYATIDEVIKAGVPDKPSCILLGEKLEDASDPLGSLARLQKEGWCIPVIFIARECKLRTVVETMRAGAFDYLTTPLDMVEFDNSLSYALETANKSYGSIKLGSDAKARVASLSKREAEIVTLVIRGLFNKEIADHMDLALVTIKVYRSKAMKKLGAGNAAEMVRIAALGGLESDSTKIVS